MKYSSMPAAAILLAAICPALPAQEASGRVTLNVVAVDSAGNPVPDLSASDFAVFDNGSRQQVVSLHQNQSSGPSTVVVLFDLMNSSMNSRGEIWDTLKSSLAHVPTTDPLFLYLLVEDGSLYPVHALTTQGSDNAAWVENIGPLLDAAMRKVVQLRPQEIRVDPTARFSATGQALDDMRERMRVLPGSKELLWVTYGVPSTVRSPDGSFYDVSQTLRQLGARFAQSGITVYSVDPGLDLQRGVLSRDSLDILTGATGGRTFSAVRLNQAIGRAEADARSSYSVEYQPPARNWDGKYHKLRVTVARKGVHLQTEHGYFAVSGT